MEYLPPKSMCCNHFDISLISRRHKACIKSPQRRSPLLTFLYLHFEVDTPLWHLTLQLQYGRLLWKIFHHIRDIWKKTYEEAIPRIKLIRCEDLIREWIAKSGEPSHLPFQITFLITFFPGEASRSCLMISSETPTSRCLPTCSRAIQCQSFPLL